jgi:hypothetical protein
MYNIGGVVGGGWDDKMLMLDGKMVEWDDGRVGVEELTIRSC